MNTTLTGVQVSPVNIDDRRQLGLKAGDTVRVHQKIVDQKGKSRIQVFEGIVLARKHGTEPGATFTVRKVSMGVGIEKIFSLYSPNIDKIEIVKRAKVRRAKLYYIREKVAREIKRQMRRMSMVELATESETEAVARKAAEEEAAAKQVEEEAAKVEENDVEQTQNDAERIEETSTEEAAVTEEATKSEVSEESTDANDEEKPAEVESEGEDKKD